MTTSIQSLAPNGPIFPIMLSSPRPPWVKYHNIIGDIPPSGLKGEARQRLPMGVVSVESARIEGVESELVVSADHLSVHRHPLSVLEVQRILFLHLEELRRLSTESRAAIDHRLSSSPAERPAVANSARGRAARPRAAGFSGDARQWPASRCAVSRCALSRGHGGRSAASATGQRATPAAHGHTFAGTRLGRAAIDQSITTWSSPCSSSGNRGFIRSSVLRRTLLTTKSRYHFVSDGTMYHGGFVRVALREHGGVSFLILVPQLALVQVVLLKLPALLGVFQP